MAKTKVVRYTESQFIELLEGIVKKVKREEKLNESKQIRDKRLPNGNPKKK